MNLLNEMENERLMVYEPFCIFIVFCTTVFNLHISVTQEDAADYTVNLSLSTWSHLALTADMVLLQYLESCTVRNAGNCNKKHLILPRMFR